MALKKIAVYTTLLLSLFLFFSCENNSSSIEGTWILTDYTHLGYSFDDSFVETGTSSNYGVVIIFDGNLMTSTGSFDLYMETTVSGETESMVYQGQTFHMGQSAWNIERDYLFIGPNERGFFIDYQGSSLILRDEYTTETKRVIKEIVLEKKSD
ncbi:MAG: hypothetical protein ED557_14750 [Balneola sp.]|nr:MAG: hypothetical protein ED557_14750 [Balneola sp.]